MLKYLPLVWSNLKRRRLRLVFTLASIAVAFLLYGLLEALRYAFGMGVDLAGADRLVTVHKTSIIQPLPAAYGNRIRGLKGIKQVSSASWFGGIYQNERNQVVTFPVDAETYFSMFPEFLVPEDQMSAWLMDRGGAVVGIGLAQQYGWKLGDVVPIRSQIWRKADGGDTWELKVDGIYTMKNGGDTRSVFMHYEYFNEGRGQGQKDLVGWYILQVDDPQAAPQIARQIDKMFENSSFETRTTTEKAMMQQWANQMGNIGAILMAVATAVFFTMLLVTANTMGQSIRERLNEIGVMKTLGYSSFAVTALVLGEALLVTALGGVIGLGLAALFSTLLGNAVAQFFPVLGMPSSTFATGAILIVVLGVIAAALPCAQAAQLKIVDALRKV